MRRLRQDRHHVVLGGLPAFGNEAVKMHSKCFERIGLFRFDLADMAGQVAATLKGRAARFFRHPEQVSNREGRIGVSIFGDDLDPTLVDETIDSYNFV